jgi:hypothetical protein
MQISRIASSLAVAAAVAGSALAMSASPASAAGGNVVDASGTSRGTVTASPSLVNVCDFSADGVTVSVEYLFADGTSGKRIAPLGGCTPAQGLSSPIVAVRGFAGTFANPWIAVLGDAAADGSVKDAAGTYRGSVTASPSLVNVCDNNADGVTVSVEYLFADGTSGKRIAPLGGCTPAQGLSSPIVAVRGFADTYANAWQPVA